MDELKNIFIVLLLIVKMKIAFMTKVIFFNYLGINSYDTWCFFLSLTIGYKRWAIGLCGNHGWYGWKACFYVG